MNALEPLVTPILVGTPLIQTDGRPFQDIEPRGTVFVTLLAILRETLLRLRTVLLTYCLSEGVRSDMTGVPSAAARYVLEKTRQHNLGGDDLTSTIMGITALLREPAAGVDVRIVFLILHAERCFPRAQDLTVMPEGQLRMYESVARLDSALQVRQSRNSLILCAPRGTLDHSIEAAAKHVPLPFPDEPQKEAMLKAALARYSQARLADGLSIATAARLATGTTNLDTESVVRRAHLTEEPVTAAVLFEAKQYAVQSLSEGVLRLADLSGRMATLLGEYLEPARRELTQLLASLARGCPDLEPLVILHGPPGVGKTHLVQAIAASAGIPIYVLQSLEDKYVGESQRKSSNLHRLRSQPEFTPNLIISDELTNITTHRDGNDSGVSEALHTDWLQALADPKYRGRSLIVATTNVPQRLPAAFQSRCAFIPVFAPSLADLEAIVSHLYQQEGRSDADETVVQEAAAVLYGKGASPRDVAGVFHRFRRNGESVSGARLLEAAENLLVPDTAWQATIYCDYWSLLTMSGRSAFPWRDRTSMPAHLAAVIDDNGSIDYDAVRARLAELAHVRV